MIRECVTIFLSIYLLRQIRFLGAYTIACNASIQTINRVTRCPLNNSYEMEVAKKKCSSLAVDAQACSSFQYHCVLSDDKKNAIGVCAPSINIIGHVCAMFSLERKGIMRVDGLNCSGCPYSYNSTNALIYKECYKNNGQTSATEPPIRTSNAGATYAIPISISVVVIIAMVATVIVKRKQIRQKCFQDRRQSFVLGNRPGFSPNDDAIRGQCEPFVAVVRSSVFNESPLKNAPANEQESRNNENPFYNVKRSEYGPPNEQESRDSGDNTTDQSEPFVPVDEISVISESTLDDDDAPPIDQEAENNDNRLQARTNIKITSKSKTEKRLLKLSIKILIKSLKNPNETWTKEKITLRVEEMIKNLHESNEKHLLEKFLDKLYTDKKVLSTLVKCGAELYDMFMSIKNNLSVTEVNISEGSVCITFYFAKKEDLENYLSKLSRHDEKLFKDLSKMILNKTFLEIFGVNYQLVQWTMSEVRAYRGREIIKHEKFQIPLMGFSEDFNNTEEGENSAVKEGNTVLEAMSGYPATTEDSLGSDDFESNQEAHESCVILGEVITFYISTKQGEDLSNDLMATINKSIGLINFPGRLKRTGFCVVDNYIVTSGKEDFTSGLPHFTDYERVTIEFGRTGKEDVNKIFYIHPNPIYVDEEHDFVVLELMPHLADIKFPPALKLFGKVCDLYVHLVGYTSGRLNQRGINVIPKHVFATSYASRKILVHSTFDEGFSGSPGIMIKDKKICVVLMLTGYTLSNVLCQHSSEKYNEKVHYGHFMHDIYAKMCRSKDGNTRILASKIFE